MFLLQIVIFTLSILSSNLVQLKPRIIGGTEATRGQFPYMVSIQWGKKGEFPSHLCGGTLLNELWILTAAHCITSITSDDVIWAYMGWYDLNDFTKGKYIKVVEFITHEDYDLIYAKHDIGLMKLSKKVEFTQFIQPVKLSNENDLIEKETDVRIIGWGVTETGGQTANDILLYLDTTTINNPSCNKTLIGAVSNNQLCAGKDGKVFCDGDSGGPLIYQGAQAGIISWIVKPCGYQGTSGVLTRVSQYLVWINDHSSI